MANISNRYASAVHSSNLKHTSELNKLDDQGQSSDADVLGAMGIADRRLCSGKNERGEDVSMHPLAVPLERMFAGDNRAAHDIVTILAQLVFEQSWKVRVKISRVTAHDMSCACLAWHRNGTCQPCGGHGKTLIPGSRSFSDHDCQVCRGTGKVPFKSQFKPEHRELADWLVAEMEREVGRAGPAAMKALSARIDL